MPERSYDAFVQVYARAGQPLSEEQRTILQSGSDALITMDHSNSYFLLNFFWALGLVNSNPLLVSRTLVANGGSRSMAMPLPVAGNLQSNQSTNYFRAPVWSRWMRFSKHAWKRQSRGSIARVATTPQVFRLQPWHGHARSTGSDGHARFDVDEMLHAARMVNTYWFPSQSQELMLYYQGKHNIEFDDIPPREAVGNERFSSRGFVQVHEWLVSNGKLNVPKSEWQQLRCIAASVVIAHVMYTRIYHHEKNWRFPFRCTWYTFQVTHHRLGQLFCQHPATSHRYMVANRHAVLCAPAFSRSTFHGVGMGWPR